LHVGDDLGYGRVDVQRVQVMNWHHVALIALTMAGFWAAASSTVTICSFLHTVMPPWETFNDFPRAQKVYKVIVYTVGYVALNGRSTLYQSLSTGSGTKASDVVKTEASKTAVLSALPDVPKP
jgi:hypothetical protein